MKTVQLFAITAFVLALFSACGDDESSSVNTTETATVSYSTLDDLPNCTASREGDTAYVKDSDAVYACSDGAWEKTQEFVTTVETEDDLPNCTESREGDTAYVKDTNSVFLCFSEKWRLLGRTVENIDSLKNCTESREGLRVYLVSERIPLICFSEKWYSFDVADFVEEEDRSSSSEENSSSSLEVSSSGTVESSSSADLSSSVASSSSATSSSGIELSSSATESSSSEESSSLEESSSSSIFTAEYDTVTTAYLNQTMLANGDYGYLTDSRDGKVYRTIVIGEQTWMAQNLNYKPSSGSYCYDDSDTKCAEYGKIYNWSEAMDDCPDGWHLPNDTEWTVLSNYIAEYNNGEGVGVSLKATSGWTSGNGTDLFGFSAVPSGYRHVSAYEKWGTYAYFWTSTGFSTASLASAKPWYLQNSTTTFLKDSYRSTQDAFPVRCLKDSDIENLTLAEECSGGVTAKCLTAAASWNLNAIYTPTSETEVTASATLSAPTSLVFSKNGFTITYSTDTRIDGENTGIGGQIDDGTWTLENGVLTLQFSTISNTVNGGKSMALTPSIYNFADGSIGLLLQQNGTVSNLIHSTASMSIIELYTGIEK